MRLPLTVAALTLAVAAAPAASATGVCVARADAPYTSGALAFGTGAFACDGPREGMTVTVCVESFAPLESKGWRTEGCATATAAGPAAAVEETASACVQRRAPVLVRTTATGANAAGESASATSAPAWAPGFGSCGP